MIVTAALICIWEAELLWITQPFPKSTSRADQDGFLLPKPCSPCPQLWGTRHLVFPVHWRDDLHSWCSQLLFPGVFAGSPPAGPIAFSLSHIVFTRQVLWFGFFFLSFPLLHEFAAASFETTGSSVKRRVREREKQP